jgi:DNA-binding NtrC family response regulator
MGSIIVILSMGYVRSNDSLTERQCLYTLLALLPLLLAGPTVLLLQHLGWQINTSLILPITSTFYLLVIVASEKVHRLTDIRAYLPFSAERKISRALFKTCTDYSSQQCSLKEAQNNCERILLLYSLEKNNYNVSKTAEMINVKRTTLYSICQRLDIPISGKR